MIAGTMLRRTSHIIFEVFIAIVVACVLLGAGAIWRLSQGPVSLGFAKPYVQEALSRRDGSLKFEVDDTIFTWAGWRRSLDIRGIGARMMEPSGNVVAAVPEISISFSLRALMRGIFAPTRVELIRPTVRMVRTEAGEFQLGFGRETGVSGEILPYLAAALTAAPDRSSPTGRLEQMSIVGGRLTVEDRILGVSWVAPDTDIELARLDDSIGAAFRLDIGLDSTDSLRRATLEGTAAYKPGDTKISIDTEFRNLDPRSLAAAFPALDRLKRLEVPFNGAVKLDIDFRGAILSADYRLEGGAARIEVPGVFDAPLDSQSLSARGSYHRGINQLVLEDLTIDLGGPQLKMSGVATRIGPVAAISGKIAGIDIPVAMMKQYWPLAFAKDTRLWTMANIEGGVGRGEANFFARVAVDGSAAPIVDSVAAKLRLRDATVHFFRPLTPVTGADVTIVFGHGRIDIAVHRGDLNGLAIGDGTIAITDTRRDRPSLEFNSVLRGPLRNALEILDHPSLKFIKGRGLHPASFEGVAATRLVIGFPLVGDLRFDQVDIKAASNLRRVRISDVVFGQPLTDGMFTLRLDKKSMSIDGSATLAGVASKVSWFENFTDGAAFVRRYDLHSTVTGKVLAEAGFGAADFFRGGIDSRLVYVEKKHGRADVSIRLGLDDAEIDVPMLGWSKPAGRPGNVALDLKVADGRLAGVSQFHVRTEMLTANGSAEFAVDGGTLIRASLNELIVGGDTDLSGTVLRRPDGSLKIALKGRRFNAEPFLRSLDTSVETGRSLPPIEIKAKFAAMKVRPQMRFTDVDATVNYDGKRWSNIFAVSAFGGGHRMAVGYIDRGDELKFSLEASDAGAALRTMGIAETVLGGVLGVTASRLRKSPNPSWKGRLKISRFRVRRAPVLTRLLSVASLTGISDVLSGKGLSFNRLVMPFSLDDRRLVVADARAVGSAIGITADGNIDLKNERVTLRGTLIPAYSINSVLGHIPILGRLITGGKGDGIFAATYSINGPLEQPKVSVNPLVALAPGFLRNLLRGLIEGGAPGPDQAEKLPQE